MHHVGNSAMFCLGNCGGGVWFDQSLKSKATIENAQIYQLGMKLARLSNSSKEVKEDFHSKAKTAWNFLTKATGILDPKTFQVILAKLQKKIFLPQSNSSFSIPFPLTLHNM